MSGSTRPWLTLISLAVSASVTGMRVVAMLYPSGDESGVASVAKLDLADLHHGLSPRFGVSVCAPLILRLARNVKHVLLFTDE